MVSIDTLQQYLIQLEFKMEGWTHRLVLTEYFTVSVSNRKHAMGKMMPDHVFPHRSVLFLMIGFRPSSLIVWTALKHSPVVI